MVASSQRHYLSLTPCPTILPSQENGGRGSWKFHASNHGLVFLVISPHPGGQAQKKCVNVNYQILMTVL